MDRGTFDILLNVFRPAVTREHAEGGRRAGKEIRVVSGETILIIYIETVCSCKEKSCCGAAMLTVNFAK